MSLRCELFEPSSSVTPLCVDNDQTSGGATSTDGSTTSTSNLVGITPCGTNNTTNDYIQNLISSQNDILGIRVQYKRRLFDLEGFDHLFGEEPHARFEDPREMRVLLNFTEDLTTYTMLGVQTDTIAEMWIPFDVWDAAYGTSTQPYIGDIFQPLDLLCNDRSGRDSPWLEITSQDSGSPLNNVAFGGTLWTLKAKRHDFSFNPNDEMETNSSQIGNDDFFGILAGGENPEMNVIADAPSDSDKQTRGNFDITKVNRDDGFADQSSVYGGY